MSGAPGAQPRARTGVARRVAVNTLSNSLGLAVVVVVNLALVPFILREVGATDYGLWILVVSITSFVSLLDIGIAAGLIKFVAEHDARGDHDEAARMLGAATFVYLMLGVTALLIGAGLAVVLPDLFSIEGDRRETARALMLVAALGAAISIPGVAPVAVLRGLQRFDIANAITAGGSLLAAALTVVALVLGVGIVGVAAAGVVAGLVGLAISVGVIRRLAPQIARRPTREDLVRVRPLLSFSAPVAFVQVAGRLQFRMDAIIIGAALPVSAIAPYNFAQRLAEGTRMLAEQFTRVLLPLATELRTAAGADTVRRLLLVSTRVTLAIALAVGIPLAIFGGDVLALWVGDEYRRFGVLVTLLAASAVMDVTTYPATAVLQGMDKHRPIARFALISGVLNVLLSVALVGPLGAEGVALATLLATVAEIAVLLLPYMTRELEVPAALIARQVLGRLAVPVAIYTGLLVALEAALSLTSLLRLACVLTVALAGYAAAYVLVSAEPYERSAYRAAGAAVTALARRRGTTGRHER